MSKPNKSSTTSKNALPDAATIRKTFVYRGRVYVRPIECGVVLRDAGTGEFEMYLDNFAALVGLGDKFADGECELEITIKRLDAPMAELVSLRLTLTRRLQRINHCTIISSSLKPNASAASAPRRRRSCSISLQYRRLL